MPWLIGEIYYRIRKVEGVSDVLVPQDQVRVEAQKLAREIAIVFQEPMTALNPLHTIGAQIAEPLRLHRGLSKADARKEVLALLDGFREFEEGRGQPRPFFMTRWAADAAERLARDLLNLSAGGFYGHKRQ